MDDMQAIEQRISREMVRRAGPSEPVDDLLLFEAVTAANRSHRWGFTMFSALKFVAAGAIVALFGGFLLGGVLTTQQGEEIPPAALSPSPEAEVTTAPTEPTEPSDHTVRADILPGIDLTVEEVEPGVFHVINDGVRDLHSGRKTDIVAGHDDGVWLLRKHQFLRLGSDTGHAWPDADGHPHRADFEVTPDGTVWVIQSENRIDPSVHSKDLSGLLFASDGDRWTRPQSPLDEPWFLTIEVAPDGTLWATWLGNGPTGLLYLGPSGWQPFGGGLAEALYPTDSGDLYALACYSPCSASRYEDDAWLPLTRFVLAFDVAPDGTVWYVGRPRAQLASSHDLPDADILARLAGGQWSSWTPDEMPDMGLGIALEEIGLGPFLTTFMAAPDGSLWASLWQSGPDGDEPPPHGLWTEEQRANKDMYDPQCDGLVRFDGETADRFLPGRCVTADIAADGSVWVLTDEGKGKDLYVITPEAMAE